MSIHEKSNSVWPSTCACHVCSKSGTRTDRLQCSFGQGQWGTSYGSGNYTDFAVCDVCCGNRNLHAAISGLENWLETADRNGRQFTFLGSLLIICTNPKLGYEGMIGAVILGGCTVMMFGSIMYEGIKMLKNCEFNDRTMIIVSLSFCIGVGLTQTSGNFFSAFPKEVGDIFNGNAVAGVFVVSLLLSLLLPKKKQAN